ncbi:YggS family pyridoxal phosphate-dependent enzyme [Streptococcaceae bacterium ESL0687]|nr:YggS family pyridoxal phosphate-dependent enzyme [Streptococcaceae bacterium ESL0687]
MTIAENVQAVLCKLKKIENQAGRAEGSVTVVGVTKYVDESAARQLVDAGINNLAENRVDLFLDKYQSLKDLDITWHLIGSLQRRKVKDVINYVDYFHALDSVKLAREISKRAHHPVNCFLQVNVSEEESKHGFLVNEVEKAILEINDLPNVRIVGLMTMAPFSATKEELDLIFSKTQALQQAISSLNLENVPCTELSMGMSRDYQEAVENGATFIRIGSEFFKGLN